MKRFKKVMFALLPIALLFTVVPATAEAWSAWQNVSMEVPVIGANGQPLAARRPANGQWRHQLTGNALSGRVQAETIGANACGVAIAIGRWTNRQSATQGRTAHADAAREWDGNRSGWSLEAIC
ncbi:MAG: hypothetical protein FWG67_09730 [Defluviitaleaceae bacterium]|nr:hypothetical protein [Defluviitaleaceae bacterium]